MRSRLEEIRDQQRQTWDKFSSGWVKWDKLVLDWLAPVGYELIRSAALRDDANVLDIAAGTGEPGLTAAELRTFRLNNATPVLFLSRIAHSTPCCAGSASCSSLMST